ncbi:MAG: hypothetical protein H7144_06645 [Burkholderiales bacterium]|nr:hypothetical protein [Phycisphaerae bacterium]
MDPKFRLSLACLLLLTGANAVQAELAKDASTDQILDALHDVGRDLKTLAADVKLIDQDTDLGDDPKTQSGRLVLQRLPDGDIQIRITFDKRVIGKREVPKYRRDFVLNGTTLIERDWNADPKKETVRTLAAPGQKLDLFKLGQGPFPLPIGQPRESVLKEFDVKLVAPEGAPADRLAIELTPKPKTALASKYKRIVVTVRRSDGWPVEVQTTDQNETQVTRAMLDNIRVNDAVKPAEFDLEPIDDSWTKIYEAYKE